MSTLPATGKQGAPAALPLRAVLRFWSIMSVIFGLIGGMHLYLAKVLVERPQWSDEVNRAGWGVLWLGLLLLPAGFLANRQRRAPLMRVLVFAGFLWMGAFQLLMGFVLPVQGCFWLLEQVGVLHHQARLEAGLSLAITLPAYVWGLVVARGAPRLEQVRIRIPDLPQGLEGLRIAQISDLHVGDTLGRPWVERVVAAVNALKPDLIAVTGDLVDGRVQDIAPEVAPLESLQAPLGTYFVTGNHEYYHGGSAWSAHAARLGMTVLHNEHRVLEYGGERFVLGGVPDLEGEHFDPEQSRPELAFEPPVLRARGGMKVPPHQCRPELAFAGAPEGLVRLLLAHQPRVAKRAQGLGVALQLSGHTHGGQMWPFNLFVRLQQPVVSGLATLHGTTVYTSRGTGYWGPPLRVGPTPEITLLTLVRA